MDLKENVSGVGGLLLVLGHARGNEALKADGLVIMQNSEKLCNDLSSLARKYESVYKGLNSLVQATVWGAVITDVATIALAIAGNHGMSIPGLTAQVPMEAAA